MIPVTFIHTLISLLSIFFAYAIVVTCAGLFTAWVAYKLGDDTPAMMGHLSWHPLAHMDVIGALCFLFLGLGWGRIIIFNNYNLSRPWGIITAYLAAIPVYFLLAIVSNVVLVKFFDPLFFTAHYEVFTDKGHELSMFFARLPHLSSFMISLGFIVRSTMYISLLLAALDLISRGFQVVLLLFFPELAERMHHDMRLIFVPLLLMILFIQPLLMVLGQAVLVCSAFILDILG